MNDFERNYLKFQHERKYKEFMKRPEDKAALLFAYVGIGSFLVFVALAVWG